MRGLLVVALVACPANDPKSRPADTSGPPIVLVPEPLVLTLDPDQRHLAMPASEVPAVVEVFVDGVEPTDVDLRLETATGEVLAAEAGRVLALAANQRLEITVGDETWMLSLTPDDLPAVTGPGGDAEGFFFLTPRGHHEVRPDREYGRYLLVVDGRGVPVWWREASGLSNDFRLGADGTFTAQSFLDDAPKRESVRIDPETGAVVERWLPRKPDGWESAWTDPHELEVFEDGTALTVITGSGAFDLTPVGGDRVGLVQHSGVQELSADRTVTAEWVAELVDMTTLPPEAIATEREDGPWRFTHINSADRLDDGWLVSLRTPNEVAKVRRDTGAVEWRLGGAHSDFTFVDDGGFFGQHSARWLGDGRVMLFDNRTNFGSEPLGDARYVEYQLDFDAMTATLVRSLELEGIGGVDYTGSVQRLPDGRTVIGWGSAQLFPDGTRAPSMAILEADDTVSLELSLPAGMYSYRAWYVEGDPITNTWTLP